MVVWMPSLSDEQTRMLVAKLEGRGINLTPPPRPLRYPRTECQTSRGKAALLRELGLPDEEEEEAAKGSIPLLLEHLTRDRVSLAEVEEVLATTTALNDDLKRSLDECTSAMLRELGFQWGTLFLYVSGAEWRRERSTLQERISLVEKTRELLL
jgi:hypothetical protein